MRTNHSNVTENAEYRIDRDKYDANYVHIFQKDKCECEECEEKRKEKEEEWKRFVNFSANSFSCMITKRVAEGLFLIGEESQVTKSSFVKTAENEETK